MVDSDRKKWFALALILAVQFMTILDIAIVNVALSSIQLDLGFSQENLQWVISAYALMFGGFLLLGGRSADLLGRRRVFMAGTLALHARLAPVRVRLERGVADRIPRAPGARSGDDHAGCALDPRLRPSRKAASATSPWAPGAPWVGSAPHSASSSAASSSTSSRGSGSSSSTCPVGVAALDPRAVPALREPGQARPGLRRPRRSPRDVRARRCFVLGVTQGYGWGWTSTKTIGVFVASAVLLLGFILWERRAEHPLVPFSIFRLQTLTAANIVGFILGTALFAMFLMLTLYMQQVLGLSPLETGRRVPGGRRYGDHLGERRSRGGHAGRRQARARVRDGALHGRAPVLHAGLA